MSTTEKNIPVHFVMYIPYEHFPDVIETLGYISGPEQQYLMSAFDTKTYAPDACIRTLSLDYSDHTHFGRALGGIGHHRSLELGNMFYFDQKPKCSKQNCKLDEAAKIKHCARNLKNGKCCDEFIRNTLGAILFPQHYGKQK